MYYLQLLILSLLSTVVAAQDGEISGRSWLDANRNGLIDPGEPGQPAEVLLTRLADGTVFTTTTDTDGNYAFTNLANGGYRVEFVPEGGVIPTFSDSSFGPGEGDSNVDIYTAPFQRTRFLDDFSPVKEVNVGWVDDGDICTEGAIFVRFKPYCSLSEPEVSYGLTANVTLDGQTYTYAWSDGQTTKSAIFLEDQQYSVTITDPAGCNYVQRGYYSMFNYPNPEIYLPPQLIPCGEDALPYRLPDSILTTDFSYSGPTDLLGLTSDELLLGNGEVTEPGRISFSLSDQEHDCTVRVIQYISKPVPTDSLYLEVETNASGNCGPSHTIKVRGGLFGRFFNYIPPGHEVQFFTPDGSFYYFDEPVGGIGFPYDDIQRQPPGTYTALVTSVCGPDRYLTITTPEAETCRSLSGRLVLDQSGGCAADGAIPIPETMIAFASTTSDREFYAFTSEDGVWSTDLPEGIYTVRPLTDPRLSATYCDIGEVIVSADPLPGLDLVMAEQAVCPVLTTEVLIPRLRREFQTISYVTYRNVGTGPAENVQLEVELEPFMEEVFSDTPFIRDGDTYTFEIGDLPAFSGGRIDLRYFLRGAELGQNHCIRSKITPAELCTRPAGWEGGIVRTDYASCDGDALTFTVANAGDAVTSVDVTYYVIRNGELEVPTTSLGILQAGESRTIGFPANGDTYQVFTNQEPNAPAATEPSAIAEGCGSNADGNFATGFAGLFPIGNGLFGEGATCRTNTGSYDPNEKLGYPLGVGTEKDIEPGTRITYDVHFQNTGTDTAIFVVIRDTLPEALDLSTLRIGGASHDYVASLDSNRVLTFRFENILLPDSTTNLAESQGVIQFSIDHDTSLVRGIRFRNNAAIFFDFNEPVITDYSHHRIAPDRLINPGEAVSADIVVVTNASCGLANGSLTVAVTAGIGPFTYTWSHDGDLRDSTASNLPGGMYSVTVTPAIGLPITLERVLTASSPITAAAAPFVTATTCGQDNGSIRLSLSGGEGALSYSWSHAAGLNAPTVTNLAPGDYAVTVTDETGCSFSTIIPVSSTPEPELRKEGQETVACLEMPGSASFLLLNFTGTTDLGFDGVPGATIVREELGPDSISLVVNGLPAGDYTPQVTDGNGCTAEVALRIRMDPPLSLDLEDQDDVACNGGSNGRARVAAQGNNPPYRYEWNDEGTATGATRNDLSVGPYEVMVIDARGCTNSYRGEIGEPDTLDVTTLIRPSTCAGSSSGKIELTVTGGVPPYTYNWLELPLETGDEVDGLAAGEYNIMITDANGCSFMVKESVTEEGNDIVVSVADSTSVTCRGINDGSITVAATGDSTGFSYAWSDGQSGPTATGLAGDQDYIVTVTNALGCSSQLRVNLLDGPLLVLNEFPEDTFICEGDAFLLDLRAYTNQLVEGQDGFSSEEALVSLADAGEYRISVTNDGGCMATTSLFLTVTDSSFEAGLSLASDAVISLPFFALDQSTPEPDSVVWLYNEAVATLEGREERTYFFDFNTPGDYTLGLVAFLQGCVDTTFANFTMHADSSTITSINGAPAASINLQVVPNPSGGVFKLTADFPKVTEATVLVYGPTGQLVLIRELPRVAALNERFDLVLPVGVYFLQLLTAEAQWIVPVVIR